MQKTDEILLQNVTNFSEAEFFARQDLFINRAKLAQKSVCIIGAGGLGSAYALALSGVGLARICLVDFDRVELSNISRQIAFCAADIGTPKVAAFARLRGRSCSKISTHVARAQDFLPAHASEFSLLIDATDNLAAREIIAANAERAGICWLFSSVEAWQFCAALLSPGRRAPFAAEQGGKKPQTAPVVMAAASFAATLALRHLSGEGALADRLFYGSFADFSLQGFKL